MSDLAPHQLTALRKLSNGKILYGGVGTGKSRVAAHYYTMNEAPKDVIVITTAKKRDSRDWQDEFYQLNVGPKSGPTAIPTNVGRRRKASTSSGVRRDLASVPQRQDFAVSREDSGGTTRPDKRFCNEPDTEGGPGTRGRGESASEWLSEGARGVSERESGSGGASEQAGVDSGKEVLAPGGYDGARPQRIAGCLPLVVQPDDGLRRDIRNLHAGNNELAGSQTHGESGSDNRSGDDSNAPSQPIWTLTVDSWNNINKYAGTEGAFFIFDEQRLVGSGQWTKAFLRISRRNNWILLSGTPGDTWMDYVPVFIANNFYKNRTDFKRQHVVYNTFTKFPKIDRYINVGRLARLRSSLLVEMPYVRHTRRRHVEVPLRYDKVALDLVLTKRWHIYENRPLRDVGEMCAVSRKLVNSDRSRLEMVKELWTKHPKLIVFYNFDYELETLRTLKEYFEIDKATSSSTRGSVGSDLPISMSTVANTWSSIQDSSSSKPASDGVLEWDASKTNLKVGLQDPSEKNISLLTRTTSKVGFDQQSVKPNESGKKRPGRPSSTAKGKANPAESSTITSSTTSISEWNGHKHEPIPTSDRWLYLVQYTAGAEGWNCTETDAVIFYSRNYSWKVWEQAQGRIDRLNTLFTDLWYYNFTTDSWIDRAIERALKAKGTFNESSYGQMFKG